MRTMAVAWDIDGTLVDSEPLHLKVLQEVCAANAVDISDLPDDAFRGVHMHDVWTSIGGRFPAGLSRDVWLAAIVEAYVARAGELTPFEGVADTVRRLRDMGLRQVCVSNSPRPVVDANLRALGIADVMEFSISFDDVSKGKPDPEPYALACARLALRPEEVVAVEDSATGVASAKGAGLFAIGFGPDGRLVGEADAMAGRLADIPVALAKGSARAEASGSAARTPPGAVPLTGIYQIDAQADRVYIEEFRRNPIGAHSPGLQRMLNVMRLYRGGAQSILVCRRRFAEYVIGHMPAERLDPIEIEDDRVFATREEAEWELFRRRWHDHTGEILNIPFRD